MTAKEKTRRSCHYDRAKTSTASDERIIANYERGCKWFALIFTAMWAVIMAMEVFA